MRTPSTDRDRRAAKVGAEPVLALRPKLIEVLNTQIDDLARAVRTDAPNASDARDIIRGFVDGIIATPRPNARDVEIHLQDRRAAMIAGIRTERCHISSIHRYLTELSNHGGTANLVLLPTAVADAIVELIIRHEDSIVEIQRRYAASENRTLIHVSVLV